MFHIRGNGRLIEDKSLFFSNHITCGSVFQQKLYICNYLITELHVSCDVFINLSELKAQVTFLIACSPSVVRPFFDPSILNFSYFHFLPQKHWANFNQNPRRRSGLPKNFDAEARLIEISVNDIIGLWNISITTT